MTNQDITIKWVNRASPHDEAYRLKSIDSTPFINPVWLIWHHIDTKLVQKRLYKKAESYPLTDDSLFFMWLCISLQMRQFSQRTWRTPSFCTIIGQSGKRSAATRCCAVGSARGLGPRGRRFESCHLDTKPQILRYLRLFACPKIAFWSVECVGATMGRPCGLPVIPHDRYGCGGRHICRPYKPTESSQSIQ